MSDSLRKPKREKNRNMDKIRLNKNKKDVNRKLRTGKWEDIDDF